MRQTIHRIPSFRFRRWSRKAYAAFASIGRHVTIGCVHKDIADKSLAKQVCTGTATAYHGSGQTRRESARQQPDEGASPGAYLTDLWERTMLMLPDNGQRSRIPGQCIGMGRVCHFMCSRQVPSGVFPGSSCFFSILLNSIPCHYLQF